MVLDKEHFETLYYQYSQRLYAYARKFLSDKQLAEDLVHDVYVRFWERYQGKTSDSWVPVIFTMVRNRCLDSLKHLTVKRSVITPKLDISVEEERLFIDTFLGESSDQKLLLQELQFQIEAILRELPERCRTVFEMSRLQCLKNSEISERLGISEKAVEKHITRALKELHKALDQKAKSIDPHVVSSICIILFLI